MFRVVGNRFVGVVLVLAMLGVSACGDKRAFESRGFTLPEGNAENGLILMEQYQCFTCHTLSSSDLMGDEEKLLDKEGILVVLGGKVSRVKTYGDLVTSVINPSHRIAEGFADSPVTDPEGRSLMTYYNSVMTVEELIDIVTYLKTQYELKPYDPTVYSPYMLPGPI